jgi:8-oxo-dGTP pyrophosphatase MutT (NUDIX family)
VIERDGKFLVVEEQANGRLVLNQPAGHLEPNESIIQACVREVLEETAHRFVPERLVGIYRWHFAAKEVTFLRFAFAGRLQGEERGRKLDKEIVRLHWLTRDELDACRERHRSPLVMRCVEDYLSGRHFPLEVLSKDFS